MLERDEVLTLVVTPLTTICLTLMLLNKAYIPQTPKEDLKISDSTLTETLREVKSIKSCVRCND